MCTCAISGSQLDLKVEEDTLDLLLSLSRSTIAMRSGLGFTRLTGLLATFRGSDADSATKITTKVAHLHSSPNRGQSTFTTSLVKRQEGPDATCTENVSEKWSVTPPTTSYQTSPLPTAPSPTTTPSSQASTTPTSITCTSVSSAASSPVSSPSTTTTHATDTSTHTASSNADATPSFVASILSKLKTEIQPETSIVVPDTTAVKRTDMRKSTETGSFYTCYGGNVDCLTVNA